MADLVALRVKIGLDESTGHAKYPNFNLLAVVLASGMDWSGYIDRHGSGWLYDCCGHEEEDAESPRGQQWGMILVPDAFATQAVAMFPTDCTRLTAAQAESFYDSKHARDFEEEEVDVQLLQKIKAKQDLGIALNQQERRAIDPRDEGVRGVRPNRRKRFSTFRQDRGFNVTD